MKFLGRSTFSRSLDSAQPPVRPAPQSILPLTSSFGIRRQRISSFYGPTCPAHIKTTTTSLGLNGATERGNDCQMFTKLIWLWLRGGGSFARIHLRRRRLRRQPYSNIVFRALATRRTRVVGKQISKA